MSDAKRAVRDSPVDFEYAVAYALHREMRRLIILYLVGSVLVSAGIAWTVDPPVVSIIGWTIGVLVAVVGAVFLFGGLVGALFKLVTDANLLANERRAAEQDAPR